MDAVPEWANYAVSGIPLLRNGQAVAQADILSQGWDTSPLRATWHTVVGLKGGGQIYVMGWQSATSKLVTSGEAAATFQSMGFADAIKLDGGGSFAFQIAQSGQKTSENRRINMARWEAEKAALPASQWAQASLEQAKAKGITDGTRPRSMATWEEVALMVNKVVEIR